MSRAARQNAIEAAKALVADCASPDALEELACRMQTQAIHARMMKRPWEEREARTMLEIAERRLAELRAAV